MTYLLIYINGHPVCPDCYSPDLITDLVRSETYCRKCGLVVRDNSINTIDADLYLDSRIRKLKEIMNGDDHD